MKSLIFLLSTLVPLLLCQCRTTPDQAPVSSEKMTPEERSTAAWPQRAPKGKIDFVRHVRPILEIRCLECHNEKTHYSGFNMETKASAFSTGARAPAIVPGDAGKSLFIQVLKLDYNHPTSMPPAPDKVWGASLKILERWIDQGAEWPNGVRLVPPQEWES